MSDIRSNDKQGQYILDAMESISKNGDAYCSDETLYRCCRRMNKSLISLSYASIISISLPLYSPASSYSLHTAFLVVILQHHRAFAPHSGVDIVKGIVHRRS